MILRYLHCVLRWFALALAITACEFEPPAAPAAAQPMNIETPPVADSCHRDIPDCSAACALRETGHLEFVDWYDRRCAAVILGKNPDKTAGVEAPVAKLAWDKDSPQPPPP